MCCILEIGSFIFGLIYLIKGEANWFNHQVIRGVHARLMGVCLMLVLPVIFGIGIVVGILAAMNNPEMFEPGNQANQAPFQYVWIDILGVGLGFGGAFVIGAMAPKMPKHAPVEQAPTGFQQPNVPNENVNPYSGDNPYNPRSDDKFFK